MEIPNWGTTLESEYKAREHRWFSSDFDDYDVLKWGFSLLLSYADVWKIVDDCYTCLLYTSDAADE